MVVYAKNKVKCRIIFLKKKSAERFLFLHKIIYKVITMNKIPNFPPKASTASAIVVGYLLLDDLDANEQNALGNWLMLTAQVICTNAYFKQLKENPRNEPNQNNKNCSNQEQQEIEMLSKMVNALNKEIAILKSKL